MHKFISFFLLLFVLSTTVAKDDPVRTTSWQKVLGWSHPDIDLYIDISTVKHDMSPGRHYSFGMLLFRRKSSIAINIVGETLLTNSFARYYIVDCNNALAAPLVDFYFNTEELPVVRDKPDKAIDYTESDSIDAFQISKSDIIFKTMCPKFI